MSTEYGIQCETCSTPDNWVNDGIGTARYATDMLWDIIACIEEFHTIFNVVGYDLDIRHYSYNMGEDNPPKFVSEHYGHKLSVVDEYGRICPKSTTGLPIN
jgi:hypothetical protein